MLKFKKNGIFSRSASEEATASELQEGGVVAVWGSPGSGKTTMAVKIAKYLAGLPGYDECPRYERSAHTATPRAMLAKFDAAKAAKESK